MLLRKKYATLFPALIILLCGAMVSAQKDYQKGYVITNDNDTLVGVVKDRKTGAFAELYKKVRFKGNGVRKRFSPTAVQAYKIGGDLFKSNYLDGEMTFLKVVSEGYVNHYVHEIKEQGEQLVLEIDYLQKGENGPLVRATQGLLGLKRKRLARFFKDCPDLATRIDKKEFRYVFEVVEFYNKRRALQE